VDGHFRSLPRLADIHKHDEKINNFITLAFLISFFPITEEKHSSRLTLKLDGYVDQEIWV